MDPITIKRCTVDEIACAPNLPDLLAEYAAESALDDLGSANPQFETYRMMQEVGVAHVLGAFQGETLIGFLVLLVSVVPHFGRPIASTESYFVAQVVRKSGAGLKLLHEAEKIARESGAVGLFVSAPTDSRLAQVLPGVGYRETNRLYYRGMQ